MSFRLAYHYEIADVTGEPVKVEDAIRLDVPFTEAALKDALTHAAHDAFRRLCEGVEKAKKEAA